MQPRFSSIALACAAVLSVMSMQVQAEPAQSNFKVPSLTNENVSAGMTTAAVRTYDTLQSALTSALTDVKRPESGNVGTSGNGAKSNDIANGTSNNGTSNNGTSNNGTNVGNNGGANNPSAVNNSSGSSTIVGTTKPYSGNPYISGSGAGSGSSYGYGSGTGSGYGSNAGLPSMPGGNGSGETDWLKVVQVAAPVIATLSGNAKVGQVVGIIGSGAQVYGQVSSGQELTAANYANIGNIALQAAAIGSKDPNLLRAAQIGNVSVGALNAYAAGKPNGASSAGSSMTKIGETSSGQAIYRDSSGATVAFAGVNASGQAVFQSATSAPASNSVTNPSGSTWGSASRERMQVSPGQMAADANAMARANGIPDYSNGETARSMSSVWNSGSGSSPQPGSISPSQTAADKAMVDIANGKLDRALAPEDAVKAAFMRGTVTSKFTPSSNSGSSSWNTGQISPEGAANAAARGTPVDNSELQGQSYITEPRFVNNANSGSTSWNAGQISSDGALNAAARGTPVDNSELQGQSYVTDPRSVNDNTTPAETVRRTYNSVARPVAAVSKPSSVAPAEASIFPAFTMTPYTAPSVNTYFADQAAKADLDRRITATSKNNQRVDSIYKAEADAAAATEVASKFNWQ